MGIVLKSFVDALYWAVALVLFFFIVGEIGVKEFGSTIFTGGGFFLLFIYAFLIIYILRVPQKWSNSDNKNAKK